MRPIDADALRDEFDPDGKTDFDATGIRYYIASAPTIDAVSVVHGRWEQVIDIDTGILVGFRCSECDVQEAFMSAYCRFCGAKMDKEESK